jgi:hypothetical protein
MPGRWSAAGGGHTPLEGSAKMVTVGLLVRLLAKRLRLGLARLSFGALVVAGQHRTAQR